MMRLLSYAVFALAAWLVYSRVRRFVHRQKLKRAGNMQYATVTFTSGTGSYLNGNPNLVVTLRYSSPGGQTYSRDVTRSFSLGQLPRRGDRMKIWVNPDDACDFDLADANPIPPGYNA